MRPLRALHSVVHGVGHWIQEAYCAVGQNVVERLEQVSDTIAERRYLASHPGRVIRPAPPAPRAAIEIPVHPILNGHQYLP